MPYDSFTNNALAGFYRSAAIVSALIFSAVYSVSVSAATAKNNYFYNAPTKTWVPTSSAVITPQGTVINNSAAHQAQTFLNNGGFSNKSTITAKFPAVNKTVPVTINARVSSTAVKTAAKSVLKGGLATIAVGAGFNALMNGLGWVMGPGGQIQKTVIDPLVPVDPSFAHYSVGSPVVATGYTKGSACAATVGKPYSIGVIETASLSGSCNVQVNKDGAYYANFSLSIQEVNKGAGCPAGSVPAGGMCGDVLTVQPVSDSDIASGVDSNYSPTVDDYPALAPYLPPDSTFVDPIPPVNQPTTTTTVTDLDTGKTTTTETNIWHNFDISNNPSVAPKVDVKTTQDTSTYTDGQLTGTSTTTTTSPADDNQPSAGGAVPPPEMPIDCDLFPTACAWMEWTQEPPEEPEDNLSELLKEVPIVNETFTITGGAAACPAPLVLNLSQFGSREVSYQPLCDLASTMKFLYLALMSFAAAVLLNRSINRV